MIGMRIRHSIPLVSLFEEGNEVYAVKETNKLATSEWLVDSGASVHVMNCKEDLNEPEKPQANPSPWEVEK